MGKIVPATQFKAQCLALIDRVAEGGEPIVISKRGRPVARLVSLGKTTRKRRPALVGCVRLLDADDDLLSTNVAWDADAHRRT